MSITFLEQTQTLNFFPKIEKENLNLEKLLHAVFCKKNFSSLHKMIA